MMLLMMMMLMMIFVFFDSYHYQLPTTACNNLEIAETFRLFKDWVGPGGDRCNHSHSQPFNSRFNCLFCSSLKAVEVGGLLERSTTHWCGTATLIVEHDDISSNSSTIIFPIRRGENGETRENWFSASWTGRRLWLKQADVWWLVISAIEYMEYNWVQWSTRCFKAVSVAEFPAFPLRKCRVCSANFSSAITYLSEAHPISQQGWNCTTWFIIWFLYESPPKFGQLKASILLNNKWLIHLATVTVLDAMSKIGNTLCLQGCWRVQWLGGQVCWGMGKGRKLVRVIHT